MSQEDDNICIKVQETTLDQLPEQAIFSCLAELDLWELARLQACSQWLKTIAKAHILRDAHHRLIHAVLDAAEHPWPGDRELPWLLAMLPHREVDRAKQHLLQLPKVSAETVEHLAQAGMQVTLQQVADSATAGVAGVEVWCRLCKLQLTPKVGEKNWVSAYSVAV